MADRYNLQDWIDKDLYATKQTTLYYNSGAKPEILAKTVKRIVKAGDLIGKCFSYAVDAGSGKLIISVYADPGDYHAPYPFDFYNFTYNNNVDGIALQEQGVQTNKQKTESQAAASVPWYESLAKGIGKKIVVIAAIAAAAKVSVNLIKNNKSNG